MSIDAEILPASHVEELVRGMIRALRAFQMYLPNNPMYQRAAQGLQEGFAPVWAVLDEVTFLIQETDLYWEEHPVYEQPNRGESFAWGLYKDGMRVLTLRKGCEEEEVTRFLQTVARARLLPADAGDDLLTLLWEQDLKRISYQFAEVVSDPWVFDPQALHLESQPPAAVTQERVREEAARPQGVIDPDDFDSTLYFLDETEIAELRRQVEEEYGRDVREAALLTLFDIFEIADETASREDVLGVLDLLLPNLLARGDFRASALILREMRLAAERTTGLDSATRARLDGLEAKLSEPTVLSELLRALDETTELPAEEDLGEVLKELRAPALGTILTQLPTLTRAPVRSVIGAAAARLAQAHAGELFRLLRSLPAEALPEGIRLAAETNLPAAVPALTELVKHLAPEVRLATVEALATLGTPGAMAALEPALHDQDRAVRVAALTAVQRRNYVGALKRLEQVVLGKGPLDLERGERRLAFETYAQLAGPPGLETLRGILQPRGLFGKKHPADTRTCAVYALGRIRTPESRRLLEDLGSDKELPVRHAATSLLREWPA